MRFKEKGYHCIHLVGSALTERQEDLLSRHFPKLILMFDGDEAGLKATEDGLLSLGRRVFVKAISLPACAPIYSPTSHWSLC